GHGNHDRHDEKGVHEMTHDGTSWRERKMVGCRAAGARGVSFRNRGELRPAGVVGCRGGNVQGTMIVSELPPVSSYFRPILPCPPPVVSQPPNSPDSSVPGRKSRSSRPTTSRRLGCSTKWG